MYFTRMLAVFFFHIVHHAIWTHLTTRTQTYFCGAAVLALGVSVLFCCVFFLLFLFLLLFLCFLFILFLLIIITHIFIYIVRALSTFQWRKFPLFSAFAMSCSFVEEFCQINATAARSIHLVFACGVSASFIRIMCLR